MNGKHHREFFLCKSHKNRFCELKSLCVAPNLQLLKLFVQLCHQRYHIAQKQQIDLKYWQKILIIFEDDTFLTNLSR